MLDVQVLRAHSHCPTTAHAVAEDTTVPQFAPYPSEIVFEAMGATTTATFDKPKATDNSGGTVAVTCEPDTGFKITGVGTQTVSCTATDTSGNPASLSFTVTAGE